MRDQAGVHDSRQSSCQWGSRAHARCDGDGRDGGKNPGSRAISRRATHRNRVVVGVRVSMGLWCFESHSNDSQAREQVAERDVVW